MKCFLYQIDSRENENSDTFHRTVPVSICHGRFNTDDVTSTTNNAIRARTLAKWGSRYYSPVFLVSDWLTRGSGLSLVEKIDQCSFSQRSSCIQLPSFSAIIHRPILIVSCGFYLKYNKKITEKKGIEKTTKKKHTRIRIICKKKRKI